MEACQEKEKRKKKENYESWGVRMSEEREKKKMRKRKKTRKRTKLILTRRKNIGKVEKKWREKNHMKERMESCELCVNMREKVSGGGQSGGEQVVREWEASG